MAYKRVIKIEDNVNHPEHYQTKSGMEVIDIIDAVTEPCSNTEAYYIGNIVKYLSRYKKKNGLEDLKKAQWYLNRLIFKLEGVQNESK